MGAAASADMLPDVLDKETCKSITKDAYNDEIFDQLSDGTGTINKTKFLNYLSRTDCFLTHDWGRELGMDNHARVAQINAALKERGLATWFDSEQMEGNIKKQMASGIDNAQCVIVFITQRYVGKVAGDNPEDNCQLEFNYAARRKTASRMIPVVMEERMRDTASWDGETGLVLGGRLYVDMCGDLNNAAYLKSKIDELYERIMKIIGKSVRQGVQMQEKHTHAAPKPTNVVTKQVSNAVDTRPLIELTVDDITRLMDKLNLAKYSQAFIDNAVDGSTLMACTVADDIKELGVTLMPKARILFDKLKEFRSGGVPLSLFVIAEEETKKVTEEALIYPVNSEFSKFATSLYIFGATGPCGDVCNGFYDPSDEIVENHIVWHKRGGTVKIQYREDVKVWRIMPLGSDTDAYAYLTTQNFTTDTNSDIGAMPYEVTDTWRLLVDDSGKFVECSTMHAVSTMPITFFACPVEDVNGVYDPQDHITNGFITYHKRIGDGLVEYYENETWHIKPKANANIDSAWAYACSVPCAPTLVSNVFKAYVNNASVDSVTACKLVPPLMVSGMTGAIAEFINGFYDVCDRVFDGWVTYRHLTKDIIIEYSSSRSSWQIKLYADRGTDVAYAYYQLTSRNHVPLPHECIGDWQVGKNNEWETQALHVDVMYYPIRVTGVTGGNAGVCNGIFYALDELCGGWVKYKKKHANVWMIFDAKKKQWCIQPTDNPGDDMYASVPAKRVTSPDRIKTLWSVWNVETAKLILQPDMYLQPDYSGDW